MSLVLQDNLAFGGIGGGGGGGSGGVTDVKVDGTSVVTSGVANVDLSGKQNKTMVTIITATSVVQDLSNNYIYSCSSNMTNVELKITGNYSADFIAQFNFSSGSTPTIFTAPNIWKWLGDDVSNNKFTPVANKRYSIMIYFDGAYIRGIVQAIETA